MSFKYKKYRLKLAKLEKQRGFSDHPVQDSHRNSLPGTTSSSSSSWSSSEFHHNHHQSHFPDQNFNDSNHNPQPQPHYYHHPHTDHHSGHFNGGGLGYGPAHHLPFSGRKRGWNHSNRGISPDRVDGTGLAKLYVCHVPRTAREQDIRNVFEPHGNVVEVVLMKDKQTGIQRGSCFVKYATTVEADKAIAALNNQYFFPGESMPATVKYAAKPDREREHLGVPDKVFVAMLNKEASRKEIEEIFSPYGKVEDVYIISDEMKQSRGCGFVKFSHTDMALAAIRALNGAYTMRGCDHPLVVRFADPKKPRFGESRSNNIFSGMTFGPHSQEPVVRPMTNLGDSMVGHNLPNAPHLAQHFSSTAQPQSVSLASNQEPSQLSQMPLQQMQNLETSSQHFQGGLPGLPKQFHLTQPSKQISEQHQWSPASGQQPPPTGGSSQEVACKNPAAAVPVNPQISQLPECDWSEHTCPDGHKYYYNCVTCESLWDKPKELALFEEQLKKQRQQQNACHKLQSSPVLSTEHLAQPQDIQLQTHVLHQNLQLQKPALSATELDHVEVQ